MSDILPPAMLSLSSLSLAMSVAYVRLDPFKHQEQINKSATDTLTSLKVAGREDTDYVKELLHLAGQRPASGKPKRSKTLLLVKFLDKGAATVCAVIAAWWLLVSSSHQFGYSGPADITESLLGQHGLSRWPFWSLLASLLLVLGLGLFGHLFVSHGKKRIEVLASEIKKWMAESADKAPNPEPPNDTSTHLDNSRDDSDTT